MTSPKDPHSSEERISSDQTGKAPRPRDNYWTRIIDGTPTIVCGIAPDGTTTFVNAAGESITGYSKDEITGQNWWRTLYQGDEYRQVEKLFRDLEDGNVRDYEMTLTTKQGKKRTLSWTSVNQYDENGSLYEIIGIGTDITEGKQAEILMRAQRDLGIALSAETDLMRALEDCLDAALKTSGMDCGGVYTVNQHGGLSLVAHKELSDEFAKSEAHFPADSPHVKLIETGEPIYIKAQDCPDPIRSSVEKAKFSVIAVLPVTHEGRAIASLNIASYRLEEIPPSSRDALEAIAAQIGTAIARIGAEEELRAEQQFLKQLLELQERERKLISYEIHDGLAQQITGGLMQLQAVQQLPDRKGREADQFFETGLKLLAEGLAETRRLIAGLRPIILDEAGVIAAVNHLINETAGREGIEIEFVHPNNFKRLMPTLETAVFRVVQEALTNVCRHSESKKARVELIVRDGRIHANVEDWGIGFDTERVEENRFGLRGIRERAHLLGGQAVIYSEPGNGTRVQVEFPLVEDLS